MPRGPRIKELYGVYYIYQTSHKLQPMFRNDEDRLYFLEILKRAQKKFDFQVFAFCILEPDTYHLVLEINGSDLSSIMKSINIGYAMYMKSAEPLFKDRYKSELMQHSEIISQKMKSIQSQHPTLNVFNNYCNYLDSSPILLDEVNPTTVLYPDTFCKDCIQTFEHAQGHLVTLAQEANGSVEALLKDKSCRNQLIHDFRKQSTLSLKELGLLFGGLSESSICKILNQSPTK